MRIDAWMRFGSCANQFLSLFRCCFDRYDWNRFSSSFVSPFSLPIRVCMRIIITFVDDDAFELISGHWVFELLVRSPRAQQDSISKHHKHHSNSQKWKKMELYAKLLFKQKKRRRRRRRSIKSIAMNERVKEWDDTAAWVSSQSEEKTTDMHTKEGKWCVDGSEPPLLSNHILQ